MWVFAAVLDTNVLYPSLQRDFLLSLAAEGVYRALWSSAILEELHECEQEKLTETGLTPLQARLAADHLVATMRNAFDDAEVPDWRRYLGSVDLPDPDDRHVVACAIAGRADAIITHNLRDFPQNRLPTTIEVMPPQMFVLHSVTLDVRKARDAVEGIVARSGTQGRPARTVEGVLEILRSRYGMQEAVAYLREH